MTRRVSEWPPMFGTYSLDGVRMRGTQRRKRGSSRGSPHQAPLILIRPVVVGQGETGSEGHHRIVSLALQCREVEIHLWGRRIKGDRLPSQSVEPVRDPLH